MPLFVRSVMKCRRCCYCYYYHCCCCFYIFFPSFTYHHKPCISFTVAAAGCPFKPSGTCLISVLFLCLVYFPVSSCHVLLSSITLISCSHSVSPTHAASPCASQSSSFTSISCFRLASSSWFVLSQLCHVSHVLGFLHASIHSALSSTCPALLSTSVLSPTCPAMLLTPAQFLTCPALLSTLFDNLPALVYYIRTCYYFGKPKKKSGGCHIFRVTRQSNNTQVFSAFLPFLRSIYLSRGY